MGTLVGRDAELARLRALLHDAAAGRAVTGLVSGDAGIGKSRLVDEAMQIAERDGFTVLCGQCAEIGDSVPYLPFADAFRTAPPRIEKAIKTRPVLSRLLPDGNEQAHEVDWAGLTRQQMFGAVLSLLSELAAESPVLLVIEDLHWADASTRHLVTFLARMLHRERVAIIGTYRTDDLHRRHPLRGVIAELLRLPMVALVELGPLSGRRAGRDPVQRAERPVAAVRRHPQLAGGTGGGKRLLRRGAPDRLVVRGGHAADRDWPRCCCRGWNACPTRPSRCCGRRRWPAAAPPTTSFGPPPGCPTTSTRRPFARRPATSCWPSTSPTGTGSGTRCCARRSTPT